MFFFFFKQKTAYDVRISDWSSDVCSSDLHEPGKRSQFELDDRDEQLNRENEEGEDHDHPGDQQHHDRDEIVEEGREAEHLRCLVEQRPRCGEARPGEFTGLQEIVGGHAAAARGQPEPCERAEDDIGERREAAEDEGERADIENRSEEHTSELQSLMRISYAVFCLKKQNIIPHYK